MVHRLSDDSRVTKSAEEIPNVTSRSHEESFSRDLLKRVEIWTTQAGTETF